MSGLAPKAERHIGSGRAIHGSRPESPKPSSSSGAVRLDARCTSSDYVSGAQAFIEFNDDSSGLTDDSIGARARPRATSAAAAAWYCSGGMARTCGS